MADVSIEYVDVVTLFIRLRNRSFVRTFVRSVRHRLPCLHTECTNLIFSQAYTHRSAGRINPFERYTVHKNFPTSFYPTYVSRYASEKRLFLSWMRVKNDPTAQCPRAIPLNVPLPPISKPAARQFYETLEFL